MAKIEVKPEKHSEIWDLVTKNCSMITSVVGGINKFNEGKGYMVLLRHIFNFI